MPTLESQVRLARGPGFEVECIRYRAGAGTIPRHSHPQYQLSLCGGGVGDYLYRGSRHHAPAGSVQVFQPDEAHAYLPRACAPTGGEYRVLYLCPGHLDAVARAELGWRGAEPPAFLNPVTTEPTLRALFLRAHAALLTPEVPPLERETRLLLLLAALVPAAAGSGHETAHVRPPGPGEHRAVRRARDFLRAHAAEPVSLAALARAAGLSAFRLSRLFTARWGLPPHAFQLQVRVERAKAALGRGEPPAQVAADCGFVDQAHLGRVFKQLVGIPPGSYARGGQESTRRPPRVSASLSASPGPRPTIRARTP